jgi:hypothetical protein
MLGSKRSGHTVSRLYVRSSVSSSARQHVPHLGQQIAGDPLTGGRAAAPPPRGERAAAPPAPRATPYLLPEWGTTPLARLDRPAIKHYFSTHPFPSPATARKVEVTLSSILRKEDLVLAPTSEARVLVRRTLASASGQLTFRPTTKTGKPRVVSLPAFLARQLQAHSRQLHADDLVFAGEGGGGGQPRGTRSPIRHELWMARVFRPAIKGREARRTTPAKRGRAAQPAQPAIPSPLPEAKRNMRFHDLRHTCASLLIANGASIMLVSQRLGHASARMTLDRYAHLYPSEEAAMAVALDAVWEAAPAPLEARAPQAGQVALGGHPGGRDHGGAAASAFKAIAVECAPVSLQRLRGLPGAEDRIGATRYEHDEHPHDQRDAGHAKGPGLSRSLAT